MVYVGTYSISNQKTFIFKEESVEKNNFFIFNFRDDENFKVLFEKDIVST